MSNPIHSFGSAIPAGWSVRDTLKRIHQEFGVESSSEDIYKDKDLLGDLINPDFWRVRDQGRRGTCNAFAVCAAEELWTYHNSDPGKLVDLSEEYLYAKTRAISFDRVGIDISDDDRIRFEQSGATFLKQVQLAIDEHGVCAEEKLRYDPGRPANFVVTRITNDAELDAADRKVPKQVFVHDVMRKPEVGDNHLWLSNTGNLRTSAILARLIQDGRPVVASFAILEEVGGNAWDSNLIWDYGEVKYPSDEVAEKLKPIGGHAVCLVGFRKNPTVSADNPGWFLFRNSYGVDDFAARAKQDEDEPISPAPGYGTISARDVDRYCWEYLARDSAQPEKS